MQKLRLMQNFFKLLSKRPNLPQCRNLFISVCKSKSCNQNIFLKYPTNGSYFSCSTQASTLNCWNCGSNRKIITSLTCDNCNVIQYPPSDDNYFKVFSIQEDFDIDQKWLTTRYRELQAILHPDKFSNKSDKERSISADYSALVNKAYNTLQIPLKRAIHMLNLRGEHIDEDQKVTDPAFLMEIMELNEEVEAASHPDQLRKLNENNKHVLKEIGKQISKYFKENNVENAKESIIKMKYYNSVNLHINGILRERGIVD